MHHQSCRRVVRLCDWRAVITGARGNSVDSGAALWPHVRLLYCGVQVLSAMIVLRCCLIFGLWAVVLGWDTAVDDIMGGCVNLYVMMSKICFCFLVQFHFV